MAATIACESWTAWTAGGIVAAQGYPAAFLVMSAVSLLGLPLLHGMRRAPAAKVRRYTRRRPCGTMRRRGGNDVGIQ